MSSQVKILTLMAWLALFLCAIVFLFIAVTAPNTVFVSDTRDLDEKIRSIESSTDLRHVQQQAIAFARAGMFAGQLSMTLCRIAIATLLLVMLGTGINLILIRRLRKQLNGTAAGQMH